MENENEDKKKLILIILIILLILLISMTIFLFFRNRSSETIYSDREVSDTQSDMQLPDNHTDNGEEFTELMGFGCLDIDKDNPYIYLINPSDNQVYLSFDVMKGDETLYKSALIAPGKMEEFDIYSCLNAGKHTLSYTVSSYDLESKAVLWSGIRQDQEISIVK